MSGIAAFRRCKASSRRVGAHAGAVAISSRRSARLFSDMASSRRYRYVGDGRSSEPQETSRVSNRSRRRVLMMSLATPPRGIEAMP